MEISCDDDDDDYADENINFIDYYILVVTKLDN